MRFIVVFIPVVLSIIYALVGEYKRKSVVGSVTLTITSLLVILRFFVTGYIFETGTDSVLLHGLDVFASLYILPLMYMYLCAQCGTKWNNREAILMVILPLLTLIDSPVILLGEMPDPAIALDKVKGSLNIFKDGERVFSFSLRGFIVIVDCVIISFCMLRLRRRIKQYGLKFTKPFIIYYIWMFMLLGFTAFTFVVSMHLTGSESVKWEFFLINTLLISAGYLLVPGSFNVSPIVTKEESRPVALDTFIEQNAHLAKHLRQLMEEDHIFLKPSVFIDDVAAMMGTNRTYVSRLMHQEYGQTFTDFVNNARIMYSKKLLLSTDMTVEEVALSSGFPSASAFCRVFKRITETTPTGWRNGQEGSNEDCSYMDGSDDSDLPKME